MKALLRSIYYALPPRMRLHMRKRITLLYHNAGYGDTLMVAAVAREIKKKKPSLRICINGCRAALLAHNPYIDETGDRFRGIDCNYHYGSPNAGKHLQRNLIDVMCRKAGISNARGQVDIFLTPEEKRFASACAAKWKRPILTIQTTSGDFAAGRKDWPREYWDSLLALLKKDRFTVVHLGASGERCLRGAINRIGAQDIRASIALIGEADLHVGVVSSLMHGAAAVHTPAVILYGGFERYSAHGYPNMTPIESFPPCAPCISRWSAIAPCPFDNRCMREISPARVYQTIIAAIQGPVHTAQQSPQGKPHERLA